MVFLLPQLLGHLGVQEPQARGAGELSAGVCKAEVGSPVQVLVFVFSWGTPSTFTPGSLVMTPTAHFVGGEATPPAVRSSTWEDLHLLSCWRMGSVATWFSFLSLKFYRHTLRS